jgi:hypothetical protein
MEGAMIHRRAPERDGATIAASNPDMNQVATRTATNDGRKRKVLDV